jgi:hypothetical protein
MKACVDLVEQCRLAGLQSVEGGPDQLEPRPGTVGLVVHVERDPLIRDPVHQPDAHAAPLPGFGHDLHVVDAQIRESQQGQRQRSIIGPVDVLRGRCEVDLPPVELDPIRVPDAADHRLHLENGGLRRTVTELERLTGKSVVPRPRCGQPVMTLTARATTRATVMREMADWLSMVSLAQRVSGRVSVGLKAVALVNDR